MFPGMLLVRSVTRAGIAHASPRQNTLATALFQCCSAKRRGFSCRDILPLSAMTRYELDRSNLGDVLMMETLTAWTPRALSVLRIITGLMIIQHGMAKLLGFPVVASFANLNPLSLIGTAGFIELIGGALLIIGLLAQPAAFIVSGEMAFAYFMVHAPKSFFPLINGGTLAIVFCFTCLYLSTAGAGPWSVDAMMKRA
jgi:putative oxidoreductase